MFDPYENTRLLKRLLWVMPVVRLHYSYWSPLRKLNFDSFPTILLLTLLLPFLFGYLISGFIFALITIAILSFSNRALKKWNSGSIVITYENYSYYRNVVCILTSILRKPELTIHQEAYHQLSCLKNKIEDSISRLDHFKHPTQLFTHINQEELWNNRSKAYNYLL